MTIFYFTSTGNCLSVAKRIGGNLISIPQVIDSDNLTYKDDVIGIIFPIYGLAPPKIVQQFLDKVSIQADYTFAIGTYGNMPGACMYNLQKKSAEKGLVFNYLNDLLMVDNYLYIFEMDDQIAKLPKKKTEEMTAKIVEDIKKRRSRKATTNVAVRAMTSIVRGTLNHSTDGSQAKKFIVNDSCTLCGTCARVCPVKNIEVGETVQFSDHCEGCEGCLHLCPHNALHLAKEKSDKRWRNPEVSLKEIIDSNNRG